MQTDGFAWLRYYGKWVNLPELNTYMKCYLNKRTMGIPICPHLEVMKAEQGDYAEVIACCQKSIKIKEKQTGFG